MQKNIAAKLFAIPDIHGQLDQLVMVLDKMRQDGMDLVRDKIVFLGDMIDRGRDSAGVIELIRDLQRSHPENVIALAGNHEDFMIKAAQEEDAGRGYHGHASELWEWNGGIQTKRSYNGKPGNQFWSDVKWLASLPIQHMEPGFFFSHAAPVKDRYRTIYNVEQPFTREELTWGPRYALNLEGEYAKDFDNGVVSVSGHNHRLREQLFDPRLYPHALFLDAGCGCSAFAPLIGCEVKTRELYYGWPFGQDAMSLSKPPSVS